MIKSEKGTVTTGGLGAEIALDFICLVRGMKVIMPVKLFEQCIEAGAIGNASFEQELINIAKKPEDEREKYREATGAALEVMKYFCDAGKDSEK